MPAADGADGDDAAAAAPVLMMLATTVYGAKACGHIYIRGPHFNLQRLLSSKNPGLLCNQQFPQSRITAGDLLVHWVRFNIPVHTRPYILGPKYFVV